MQDAFPSTGGQDPSIPPVPADLRIVFCTFPDAETARLVCNGIISENHAACVNLIPAVESIYRWQGEIEQAHEVLAIFKVPAAGYLAFQRVLLEKHPYDTPEILAVTPDQVSEGYLQWILMDRTPSAGPPDEVGIESIS